jgi:OmcA/MtrC family decaheme c-type cytochrome
VDGTEGGTVVPTKTYGPDVTYPAPLQDCEKCHVAGATNFSTAGAAAELPNLLWSSVATSTYTPNIANNPAVDGSGATNYGLLLSVNGFTADIVQADTSTLVSSPISAACFSCHDDQQTHMEANGGKIYRPRSQLVLGSETCLTCHGKDAIWDVEKVH